MDFCYFMSRLAPRLNVRIVAAAAAMACDLGLAVRLNSGNLCYLINRGGQAPKWDVRGYVR